MPSARDVPDEWRRSVRDHIRAWAAKKFDGRKYTTRQLADALRMKQPTVVQLLNVKGSFGLHILAQVRAGTGISLDELVDWKRQPAPAPDARRDMSDADIDALARKMLQLGAEPSPHSDGETPPPAVPGRRSSRTT